MADAVHPLRDSELDWAVQRLARRRVSLVPFAPVLWRPALDAERRHLEFLTFLVLDAGALAFRAGEDLLIAAPSRGEWVLDDVAVDAFDDNGEALWSAFAASAAGDRVRMVCPVPEPDKLALAGRHGLEVVESWWHLPVTTDQPATPMAATQVGSQVAQIVFAPPVYEPGGPVLFLRDPDAETVAAAPAAAAELGCVLVVAAQTTDETADVLTRAGFVRHADFAEGPVEP